MKKASEDTLTTMDDAERLVYLESLSSSLEQQLAEASEERRTLQRQVEALSRSYEAIERERDGLSADIVTAKREYDTLHSRYEHLQSGYDRLVELVKTANARAFGARSERILPHQVSLFNDMEASVPDDAAEGTPAPSRRRKKRKPIDWSRYDTEIVEHELVREERVCPACGGMMDEMDVEVKRVVKMIPAHVVVEEHRRHVYACKTCSKANARDGITPAQIKRADMPAYPLGKSFAHPSLVADILYRKYCLHQPIYRIANDLQANAALGFTRQSIAGWVISAHRRWLAMLYELMKRRMLMQDILHIDETTVQVLKEPKRKPGQKAYMWLFATTQTSVPIYVFHYDATRSRSVVEGMLAGWSGTIVTDGYAAYENLGDGIRRVSCLVHIRRKFTDVMKGLSEEQKASLGGAVSSQALGKIADMFKIDNGFDTLTPEERQAARARELAPKMRDFHAWCTARREEATPGLALYKALNYAIGQWPALMHALDDGRLPLENNRAERAIRPFAVGRKGWLFSDTVHGAEASAAIFSITTTAIANNLNARSYLEWLLTEMPNTPDIQDDVVLSRFLPWSDDVPDRCRIQSAEADELLEKLGEPLIDVDPSKLEDKTAS